MKVLAFLCLTALAGCAPASPQKTAPQDAAIQKALQMGQQSYQQKASTYQARPALASSERGTYGPTASTQKKQMMVCRYGGTSQYLITPADQPCPSRP
ncbi:hypothetical protein SAMN05444680_107258 [Variovorax sp. YR216]|nr:hypothetical protein SAMN05444680_107258 [Variovorax sp. YR216]